MKEPKTNGSAPYKILFLGSSRRNQEFGRIKHDGAEAQVFAPSTPGAAMDLALQTKPQLVVVDLDHEEYQPLEFAGKLLDLAPRYKVIGLTEATQLSKVVNAIKMGFHDVLNTNEEPYKLEAEISKLIKNWEELEHGEELHRSRRVRYDFGSLLCQSPEMKRVLDLLAKIIRRKWVTVLIRGETGTGKELIARAIHHNNFDQFKQFVEINCSALPENLLESELFGYEKGAFTDAKNQKQGLFELAHNGTLFLDEIGEICPSVQIKLLKAIEEKKIRRLGGIKDIHIRTRLISATNRDLQAAMQEGHFREDLYYRLNVITIHLPPLRDRGHDVVLLARHFLTRFAKEYESPISGFTAEAESLLKTYHWPGNVRELKHTIERIVLLGEGAEVTWEAMADTIDSEIPLVLTKKSENSTTVQIPAPTNGISLDDGEKTLIQEILDSTGWNKRQACKILKISRPRLDRKIHRYQIKKYPLS